MSRTHELERATAIVDYLQSGKEARRPIDIAHGMQALECSVCELLVGALKRIDKNGRVYLDRGLHYRVL